MKRCIARRPARRWTGWATASLLALSGAGCTNATGSTEPALAQALRPHIGDAQPPCLRLDFPVSLTPEQAALKAPLRALVRAGLLVEHDHFEQVPLSRTGRLWVPAPRFELTERGRHHYQVEPGGFCL